MAVEPKSKISDEFYHGFFPEGFIWGLANSAYQTEGSWNTDGKGENIWDRFCHSKPERISDKSNGDTAMNSYHNYKEDVKLLKDMGAKMYRISISWARVLPLGTMEKINKLGIDYYNNLINELIVNGIQPMITLFHWDLPQNLEDMGGWLNEDLIGVFGDYARVCFKTFGDRVKYWVTINEPFIFSNKGYDVGTFAPGIKDPAVSPYQCIHTMIKAHALAFQIYNEEFREVQKGKVGISLDSSYFAPADPESKEDVEATERAYQFRVGCFANPIFYGCYPTIMREIIDKKSKAEGRSASRLPSFDAEWEKKIKGSLDFFGINHYTAELVKSRPISPADSLPTSPSWSSDQDTQRFQDPKWTACGASWQKDVPWGLRKLLVWIKDQYDNPETIITENGMSETTGTLDDESRIRYFRGHINEVLKAIKLDGCNITGYLAWCLLDVFEWSSGYTVGFGVHHVDRNSVDFTRTPKKSAEFLKDVFRNNGFP